MFRAILPLILVLLMIPLQAQRVLHFTKTSGFDHNTRSVSYAMFNSIGEELDVLVDDDADGSSFSDLATLQQYAVIVFSNTSGNAILDQQQRSNFEQWVAAGGRVMGIHAASDTYRHSTANGGGTGIWDFYAELIGGSVQADPHHVAGTPSYAMSHLEPHASTANLPDPWQKEEEYYYWENGYLHPEIQPVLEVEQTVGPNGQVNSYDAPRPMSWYRITSANRVFYTALGHAASNFTSDPLFRHLIKDALAWLLQDATSVREQGSHGFAIHYERDLSMVVLQGNSPAGSQVTLLDTQGRTLRRERMHAGTTLIGTHGLAAGIYLIHVDAAPAGRVVVW